MRATGMASRALLVAVLGLAANAPDARADEAAASPTPLSMTVTPGDTPGAPWKLRVVNTGDVPVRIAADVRLLSFELVRAAPASNEPKKPRKATPKNVHCALPASARPQTDEGHELVVPGKRAWSTVVDPLFLCFDAPARAALVPGTEVRARFGFASRSSKPPTSGPFVAAPVGAAIGVVPPVRELAAPSFVIPETPPPSPVVTPAPPATPLRVSATPAIDAENGRDVALTVTVQNRSDKTVTAFVRPSTLRFRVDGPRGPVACGTPAEPPAIRDLYATLAPKRSVSHAVRLAAYCPPDTFDEPGIYRVRATLDTTGASGAPVGLKTWDDVAESDTDALVRIRAPRRDPAREAAPKPTLE